MSRILCSIVRICDDAVVSLLESHTSVGVVVADEAADDDVDDAADAGVDTRVYAARGAGAVYGVLLPEDEEDIPLASRG